MVRSIDDRYVCVYSSPPGRRIRLSAIGLEEHDFITPIQSFALLLDDTRKTRKLAAISAAITNLTIELPHPFLAVLSQQMRKNARAFEASSSDPKMNEDAAIDKLLLLTFKHLSGNKRKARRAGPSDIMSRDTACRAWLTSFEVNCWWPDSIFPVRNSVVISQNINILSAMYRKRP